MIEDALQVYLELLENELELDPQDGASRALTAAAQILQLALSYASEHGYSEDLAIKLDPKTLGWITSRSN